MTSEPIRGPVTDHLLSGQDAALVVIDYQPSQIKTVASMDREVLVDNIVSDLLDLQIIAEKGAEANLEHIAVTRACP